MTVGVFNAASQRILAELEQIVRDLLAEHGVPTGSAALYDLVALLMPYLLRSRESLYREAVLMMGRQIAEHGYQVRPAPVRDYTAKALYDSLAKPLGLFNAPGRVEINLEILDPESQRSALETFVVDEAMSFDERAVERTAKKFTAIAKRHAADAARQAIADTSVNNEVRPEPERTGGQLISPDNASGVTLGWARVLTGAENCAFCMMLASRGPVYDEDTVVTTSEGRTFHENCDCVGTLVIKGRRWEGESQFKRLRDVWDDASNRPTEEEKESGQAKPITRFHNRAQQMMQEDPAVFVPESLQV